MANLTQYNLDPSKIDDMGDGFKVVPPGIYNVVIVDSEVMDTKNGGKLLMLKYQVIDGQYVGDTLVDRINLVNSSEMAQKIGLSQFKNICDAVGHKGVVKDSKQLHGKPLSIKVSIEKFESNKEAGKMLDSNKVEKRMARQAAPAAPAVPPGHPAAGEAPPQRAAMGW